MARVLLYERVVDAVLTRTSPSRDTEIQNGMKIKDEPVDTTLNTDMTDTLVKDLSNLENDTLSRNCYNMINHDESSLPENDVPPKTVNNKKSKHISNSHSAYIDGADKTFNLKRKRACVKTEQVRDALSQSKKKQKRFNDFQISKNENINTFTKTTEKLGEKRKQQNITSDSRTKMQRTIRSSKKRKSNECNICFRKFSTFRNCESHKQYYIGDYQCKNCKRHHVTRQKLDLHTMKCYNATYIGNYRSNIRCNFCNRVFKHKALLQSHLFHVHNELIYSNNIIKRKKPKSKNVNTFDKNDTSKTDAHKESPCLNNLIKSEKRNILKSNNKSWNDDDATKTENLRTEELSSDGMSPMKKLRQPTLTEYLELCKRKRDINASPNKFNIMKDGFSSALFHDEKTAKSFKPKSSEMYNKQVDSLSAKSSNLEQMAYSTLEQDRNREVSKKPFVKLHADVEMMKSFLEKLPNTSIDDKVIEDQGIYSCYHEVPYSLRSLRTTSSAEIISNSRKRNSKDVSKKSQLNTERSIEMEVIPERRTEHDVTNSDKIDSNFWETIMVRFKCKDCKIILTRCDEKINCHLIPATKTTFKENIQCNSMFQESDIQNKIVLKELEVSLERLTTVPAVDIKMKTVSEVEKCNDDSFLCKVCKKSFSSKSDKHMHIKSSHIAYMSSICDARYKLKHKLLEHYLSEHLSKQNQCCVCYVLLSNYVELKQHLNVHCLKYVQRENDQYPIDTEIKCSSIKNTYKCFRCNMAFLTQSSLMMHQSFCILQEERTKDQEDSMKNINTFPKMILKVQRKNADENTVIRDEKIHFDECSSKNSVEMTNKHRISLINEEDQEITEEDPKISEEEPKINEDKQISSVNNNLVTKEIGPINESQNSEKLLENGNSTISNHDVPNAQLDAVKSKITIYPCDICGKQFHSRKNLQQHLRTFNYTTDICPICGTAFSSKRLLQTHITAAHVPQISKTYSFHCVFCNQGFIKKYELRPHILHLHGQEILDTITHDSHASQKESSTHTAMCNVCNLVFETHDRYMDHKMYYYKNHTFTCSLCAQNFQGMYMLDHHNKLTHYSEDKRKSYNYICGICNEGFNLESHFHSHNMHIHLNEENLTEIAKESEERSRFDHASEVQEQIRNFSTNHRKEIKQSPNEYTCQICQLKCIDTDDMAKHTAFYSNDGDFRCDRCKRQFRTLDLLYQHRKLTHLCRDIYNGHVCHVCGEVLETVISLECHKKHFHLNDIVCDNVDDRENCEQTLSSNASKVIKHQLKSNDIHNTAKYKYNCMFCDMKFFSTNAIQTHIIQAHIDDLFAKRTALKSTLSTIKGDDIGEQFVQQLVEVDQTLTSPATLTSTLAATTTSSSSATTTPTSVETTTILTSAAATTTLTSTAATTTLTSAAATTTSTATTTILTSAVTATTTSISATTAAATFKDNSTPLLQDNISNNILDKNGKRDKINIELPNQIKAILPEDNKIAQKNSAMLSISGFNILTPIAASNQFNANNPKASHLLSTESTNDHQKSYTNSSKSRSINELKADKLKAVYVIQPNGDLKAVLVVPRASKSNEIINQKSETMSNYNCNSSYMCPLCSLQYPSLMFFHAHLRYAHADFIRTDMINPQLNQSTQKVSRIKCLLCLCRFTDENRYKSHLKNSHTHYVHIPNSENVKKTVDHKNSTTPEIITVDDDDNVENSLNQRTVEATAMPEKQNEKIGKLRVKPFAKIMENLSTEYALKLQQSKPVSHFS